MRTLDDLNRVQRQSGFREWTMDDVRRWSNREDLAYNDVIEKEFDTVVDMNRYGSAGD